MERTSKNRRAFVIPPAKSTSECEGDERLTRLDRTPFDRFIRIYVPPAIKLLLDMVSIIGRLILLDMVSIIGRLIGGRFSFF
jgi:hypothetical protein